jgi:hypothetical protein
MIRGGEMMGQVDLFVILMMGSLFTGYLLGVRLLEAITARLHSITFIKSVHTIIFVPLSGLLFGFVYEVTVGRITYLTWIALAVFLAEGVVLRNNNGRCPLTKYAERLGSTHGQITDFFFPKWFADRVFLVYGGLFALSVVFLVIRLLR